MTSYFDDFPGISYAGVSDISHFAAEKLLTLLGIDFSKKEHKRLGFAKQFIMLGVNITFPLTRGSMILVDNTAERKTEVELLIKDVLAAGTCSKGTAATLFGKLGFMSSQTWSRVGPLLTWALRERANSFVDTALDDDLRSSLASALVLVNAPPREVVISSSRKVRWLFTDAAVEPSEDDLHFITIGGVLLGEHGTIWRHYSERVPDHISALWRSSGQPITYAESLAALVAKVVWHRWLEGCDCVVCVDNIGAQQSLIRYNSRSPLLRGVLRGHLLVDSQYSLRQWVTWVPSESNVADAPSRLDDA